MQRNSTKLILATPGQHSATDPRTGERQLQFKISLKAKKKRLNTSEAPKYRGVRVREKKVKGKNLSIKKYFGLDLS